MSLTRTTRLAIVFGASITILGLMMISVDPEIQYTVDEIMTEPEKFEDGDVFVRGIVSVGTFSVENLEFILEGSNDRIMVDFSDSPLPDGFDEGRTIAVRGELVLLEDSWVIISNEIQTGCPSKYEA